LRPCMMETPPRRWRRLLYNNTVREGERVVSQVVDEPLGDDVCMLLVAYGKDGGKVVARVAGGDIAFADSGPQDVGKILQETVADLMAVSVADDLEIVDVDVQEGKHVSLAH